MVDIVFGSGITIGTGISVLPPQVTEIKRVEYIYKGKLK